MLYNLYLEDNRAVSKRIRSEYLETHLAYLDAHADIIVLGGALLEEDGETRIGSAFILNVGGQEEAERFLRNEPFHNAGLYATSKITRMRRGQWHPDRVSSTPDG